jgi:hypothetical protein
MSQEPVVSLTAGAYAAILVAVAFVAILIAVFLIHACRARSKRAAAIDAALRAGPLAPAYWARETFARRWNAGGPESAPMGAPPAEPSARRAAAWNPDEIAELAERWDKPKPVSEERVRAVEETPECLRDLPRGWTSALSRHHAGRVYYVHTATGFRTMERPNDDTPAPYEVPTQKSASGPPPAETISPLVTAAAAAAAAAVHGNGPSPAVRRGEPPIVAVARDALLAELPPRHARRMVLVHKSDDDDTESVVTSESDESDSGDPSAVRGRVR